jgi:hypothetical protein
MTIKKYPEAFQTYNENIKRSKYVEEIVQKEFY